MMHWLMVIFQYFLQWFAQVVNKTTTKLQPLLHRVVTGEEHTHHVSQKPRSTKYTPPDRILPTTLSENPPNIQQQIRSIPHVLDRPEEKLRIDKPKMWD